MKAGRKKLHNKLNQLDYELIMCQIADMVDKTVSMNRVVVKGYGAHSLQSRRLGSLINKLNEFQECIEQEEDDDPLWINPLMEKENEK